MKLTPEFPWLDERGAGLLVHPTSLPNNQGIGTLGAESRRLIDFIADSEMVYWQMLPLGPTGFGDSPYSTFSVFAGNPYLIDMEALADLGLLTLDELSPLRELPAETVDFGALFNIKWALLRLAFRRFKEKELAYLPNYSIFSDFKEEEKTWLYPYSLFMALKEFHGGQCWVEWDTRWKDYSKIDESSLPDSVVESVEAYSFFQYLFFGQWKQIRNYAGSKGVQIIGDIPIYVAHDSADVWSQSALFDLDKDFQPKAVAGVPPDYFSDLGQFWGNPLYRWDYQQRTQFKWWKERIAQNLKLFDVLRLDHFRAFFNYWSIPANAPDARGGEWVDGPQEAFFQAILDAFGVLPIIAEDLGELEQPVHDFLDRLKLPGMAILQFAFDGEDASNIYLPHNLKQNAIVYGGTHDNDTLVGWYESQPNKVQDQVRRYFRVSGEDIAWDFIRAAYRAVARIAIVPMQDILSLGADARMNCPGEAQGNWQWRMTEDQFNRAYDSAPYLRELAWLYGR